MSYLSRAPGMHRCICGWEGKPQRDKKAKNPVDKCPQCSEKTVLIPLREIPGFCFCCASTNGKLQIIDHTMVRECRICGAKLNLHTVKPWIWEVKGMVQAVNKLRTEMEASKNPYVKVVGEHLLKVLEINPAAAEKVLAEGKTIAGALTAMKTEASKNKFDGMAMLTDEEGYAIALKYFGFTGTIPTPAVAPAQAAPEPPPAPVTSPPTFGISVDDLFGDL